MVCSVYAMRSSDASEACLVREQQERRQLQAELLMQGPPLVQELVLVLLQPLMWELQHVA